MAIKQKEKTITEIIKEKKQIPKSWQAVKGILKDKKIDPVKWQRKIRNEWKKREERLHNIYKSK